MDQTDIGAVLAQLDKVRKAGSGYIACCPAHRDNNPSLSVDIGDSGQILLNCFAGCSFESVAAAIDLPRSERRFLYPAPKPKVDPTPVIDDIEERLCEMQSLLPGSPAEAYLQRRGISPRTALRYGLGYAPKGTWPHRNDEGALIRQGPAGRAVFPHETPSGLVVNFYGRSIANIPRGGDKRYKHDHLPGNKGVFNGRAIARARKAAGRLYLVEGTFDALSLIELGAENVVGVFGLNGIRWDWLIGVRELIIGLDLDEAGEKAAAKVFEQASKEANISLIRKIPAEAYGDGKDLNDALVSGSLAAWFRA